MGSACWPALGGKPTGSSGHDWYSMFAFSGSGTNLNLTLRNQSGADRLRLGLGPGSPETEPPVASTHGP